MMNFRLTICCCLTVVLSGALGCNQGDEFGPIADSSNAMTIRKAMIGSTGGGASEATDAPTGTGWATLRGKFIFEGTPPEMPAYNVNKDQATCAPGGTAPPQETLIVDSASGGIKNIAIYLRSASRVHESAESNTDPVVFDQKDCVFLTHVLTAQVGQPLELKNSDNVGHNTKIDGRSNSYNQIIPAGGSLQYVAQREETTPAVVNCSIHPWMTAYFLPRKNGYVAITAEDGSFEIANLPAGEELEIQVWHESATGSGNGLVLSDGTAKELNWSKKGRFTVKLEADSTKEIELKVPASAFRG